MNGSSNTGHRGCGSRDQQHGDLCLTMHQPWASLLIHGMKRIEGRSWAAPLTGRLWIHAASKIPDRATIEAMEEFYRKIYAADGITNIKFPGHYPVSQLLGCVEVVGCVRSRELACWEAVPESVRLEGLTEFCWLCETPQRLLVPLRMRGYQGVYSLEARIYEAAVRGRGLCPMFGPQPVKFPLPFSLKVKPGSVLNSSFKKASIGEAIAGARAAANQFLKKDQSTRHADSDVTGEERRMPERVYGFPRYVKQRIHETKGVNSGGSSQDLGAVQHGAPSYLKAAMRNLKIN